MGARLKAKWPVLQMPPNPKEEEMGSRNRLTLQDQEIKCLYRLFIFLLLNSMEGVLISEHTQSFRWLR